MCYHNGSAEGVARHSQSWGSVGSTWHSFRHSHTVWSSAAFSAELVCREDEKKLEERSMKEAAGRDELFAWGLPLLLKCYKQKNVPYIALTLQPQIGYMVGGWDTVYRAVGKWIFCPRSWCFGIRNYLWQKGLSLSCWESAVVTTNQTRPKEGQLEARSLTNKTPSCTVERRLVCPVQSTEVLIEKFFLILAKASWSLSGGGLQ